MLSKIVIFLLLHSAAVPSSSWDTITTYGEYAKIEFYVEYVPTNASVILSNVSDINSAIQCARKCMSNEMCVMATYYADLRICRLFSADDSQGTISGRANAEVIRFVDRLLPIIMMSGNWYLTENMTSARDFHKSTFIVATNSVLIVGGSDGSVDLSSTEAFFSSSGSFLRQGSTSAIRRFHTVDRLNDRIVVIAGGWSSPLTAELYDAIMGVSNVTIGLSAPRAEHISAIIDDGGSLKTKLLLVGGLDNTGKLATGDIFNTMTGVFTAVGNNMSSSRYYHTATAIGNGLVLLAGGINNDTVVLASLELYNSSSNLFVPLSASMSTGRYRHTATYIPSIQAVLFVGGQSQTVVLKSYDLFNVSTFTFVVLNASALNFRTYHTATLLLNEQVLIVGGEDSQRLSSCEVYNPLINTFTSVGNMSMNRADHTATLLTNTGQVLVCGGENQNNTVLNSCELYQP